MFADDEAIDYDDDDVQQIQQHEPQRPTQAAETQQVSDETHAGADEGAVPQHPAVSELVAPAPSQQQQQQQQQHEDQAQQGQPEQQQQQQQQHGQESALGVTETSDHSLPPGWQAIQSRSAGGDTYYYNSATGESTWDRPTQPAISSIVDGIHYVPGAADAEASVASTSELQATLQPHDHQAEAHTDAGSYDESQLRGPSVEDGPRSSGRVQAGIEQCSETGAAPSAVQPGSSREEQEHNTAARGDESGQRRAATARRAPLDYKGASNAPIPAQQLHNQKRRRNERREERPPQGISIRGTAASAASANPASSLQSGVRNGGAPVHPSSGEDRISRPTGFDTGPKGGHDVWPPPGKRRRKESEEKALRRDSGWGSRSTGSSSTIEQTEAANGTQGAQDTVAAAYASRNKIKGLVPAPPDAITPPPKPVWERSERGGGSGSSRRRGRAPMTRPRSPDCYRPAEESALHAPPRAALYADESRQPTTEPAITSEPVSLLARLSRGSADDGRARPSRDAKAGQTTPRSEPTETNRTRTERSRSHVEVPNDPGLGRDRRQEQLQEPSAVASSNSATERPPPIQADTPAANRWGRESRSREPERQTSRADPPVAASLPEARKEQPAERLTGWEAMRARRSATSQPATPAREPSRGETASLGGGGNGRRRSRTPPAGTWGRSEVSPRATSTSVDSGWATRGRGRGRETTRPVPMRQWGKPEPPAEKAPERELTLEEREERIRQRERELGLI
ncbi:hypothetical protein ACQY0O_008228 [Thecaphora frezii]